MAHRLHKTARWQRLRRLQLSREPLCRMCRERGRTKPADTVDHIIPHRGDPDLFFDLENLQSLCSPCHDGAKQAQERTGRAVGCDPEGVPLDAAHHWQAAT